MFFGIRDPGWEKPGSGIRDKHPGSATLSVVIYLVPLLKEFKQIQRYLCLTIFKFSSCDYGF